MNHPFVIDAARGILSRPEIAAEHDTNNKSKDIYHLIYIRAPTEVEMALTREFLAGLTNMPYRWQSFAQALFMANEFVFVD